jgi:PAS domain S-box-containing protein
MCLALAVFAIGVAASIALSTWQARRNAVAAEGSFDLVAARTVTQLEARLAKYEYGLRGARGVAVGVRFDQLTRARFRAYSETRDIDREFPGARGMGIIRRISKPVEADFVAAARRDGKPDFALRQLSPHSGDRYVIQYIEPIERNEAAVGLDIASEPNRRGAADAAMRSGRPTLSAPITLVQATGKTLRSFLLLLPIYEPAADLTTAAERERATQGFAYAPLIMDEVLADFDLGSDFTLVLRDVEADEAGVFFATPGHGQPAAAGLARRVMIPIYERRWQAELKATPAFVTALHLVAPRHVLLLGLAVSTLLAILGALVAQSRERAAQVTAERARRAAIVDCTTDAVIGETLDGIVTDWNPGAERLFGYAAAEAIGRSAASLILPEGREAEDAELRATVARGESVPAFDTTRCCADGRVIDVSVTAAPIASPDGAQVGFSKTIRDISDAKRAAQKIAELNSGLEEQVRERTALLDAAQRDLRNILDAVPSLVSYWGQDLRNRFANRAYESWFGWDPESMPGKHMGDLVGERISRTLPRLEAALRGEPQVFETTITGVDGAVRHAVAHFSPDVVAGKVRGFYVFVYDVTAQTLVQEKLAAALRDHEALLRAVQEHAIVSVTDRAGRITDINQRFCDISGYSRDELLGQNHRLINSGLHEPGFWSAAWRSISAGKPWRGEVCNRKKDGSLYWVDSMIAPFAGSDGRIERYISIRFDITAAKENEKQLKQTSSRITMATDAAGIGIWEWDLTSHLLTWDDWMYRLYGQPPAERAQPYALWSTSLHPDDRERAERELNVALTGERPFDTEFRIFRPDGEIRHLKANAQVLRDASGKALRMTGVNFDISERKRAELELTETSSLLRTVLESASEVSIIATDPKLVIKVFNSGAERLLGYSAAEIMHGATPALFHDPTEVEARAQELAALSGEAVLGGTAFVHPLALGKPREWTYVRKDGQRVAVSLIVTPMYGDDGELFGYLGIAHDVTRQKQYEATLRDAMHAAEAASQAKSQFLANVSHEIRTPMNAVLGIAHLFGQTALDSEQAVFLSKIHVASRSLLALLNDVLDVSKIEAGELQLEHAPFSLATLVGEVAGLADLQAQAKNLEFKCQLAANLPDSLQGDVTRVGQVLTNLLSNAIKFTPRGSVTLRVYEQARDGANVTLSFAVEDTGIGVEPEVQKLLFQPFVQADTSTTRRFGGTGLGLSIVKRLATMMNGDVGLESWPGVGSVFWATIPFALAAASSVEAKLPAAAPRENALRGARVLVVDDSEVNLFVAQRILTGEGAQVTLASDGQQAIEQIQMAQQPFDVVLMDVQMPVMDGYRATELIRNQLAQKQLPIIALTADARTSERERALRVGMTDFLSKPFEAKELIARISRLLPEPSGAPTRPQPRPPAANGGDGWPEIDGIDGSRARELLDGDQALFRLILLRVVKECPDVSPPADLGDEQAVRDYAARVHRLRGSFGQLGAVTIGELGRLIEIGFRSGKAARVLPLVGRLRIELQRLCESALATFGDTPRAEPQPPLSLLTADPDALSKLLERLRQQDLAALEEVRALSSWGRQAWGDEPFERFKEHVEALRFDDAAKLLAGKLGSVASQT